MADFRRYLVETAGFVSDMSGRVLSRLAKAEMQRLGDWASELGRISPLHTDVQLRCLCTDLEGRALYVLRQPVATDLLRVEMSLRINGELAHISDESARIVQDLADVDAEIVDVPEPLARAADVGRLAIENAVEGLITEDAIVADRVQAHVERLPGLNRVLLDVVAVGYATRVSVRLAQVSRSLEHVGACAARMARSVVQFVKRGQPV